MGYPSSTNELLKHDFSSTEQADSIAQGFQEYKKYNELDKMTIRVRQLTEPAVYDKDVARRQS